MSRPPICRGAMSLGSGCGKCDRCLSYAPLAPKPERAPAVDPAGLMRLALEAREAGACVKFKLPAGVFLSGLYHLGDGVFVGALPGSDDDGRFDPKKQLVPPHDRWVLRGEKEAIEAQSGVIPMELCPDPLPSFQYHHQRVARTELCVRVTEDGVLRSVFTGDVVPE